LPLAGSVPANANIRCRGYDGGMSPATALLLHGFASGPASMWRFQEWLAELGYQAEARAQLGHGGRGPAADYSLAALAADNLAMGDHDLVVGHSMGGATATLAAARRPAWAGRLVLVDPALRFPTTQEASGVKQEELAALDRDAGEIRAAYSAWDERDGAAKVQEVARVWRPAVEGIIDANLDADLRDAARSLAVPTLVICGDPAAGGAVTHADGDAVASANPNVRLARIAGAGHNPHRDDPEAVRRALLGWLAVTR
jgi:pimeloyl-ACP methyl ester carboxylesterase